MQTATATVTKPTAFAKPAAAQFSSAGVIWLKLAVLYLVLGISVGIGMGVSQNFTLHPVHAHINLLGWTTMALAGLIYSVFPQAGASVLARVHFWLLNLALPVMMVALSLLLFGMTAIEPVLAISEIIGAVAIVVFAANLFINLKR